MLSEEDLADIVKDEAENFIKKGKVPEHLHYYLLLNGKMYPQDDYNKEVAEGKLSPNDIYAYVDIYGAINFDAFLLFIDYLETPLVERIIEAYLRKSGFTIKCSIFRPPAPNLKYYIDAIVGYSHDTPEYLGVNIYDIDSIARTLHIPQIVQQKLGNEPGEVTCGEDVPEIYRIVTEKQPILAGYTYEEAYEILREYYTFHIKEYKDEAYKIVLAYSQLFPTPYRVCYKWEARTFDKIDCLKLELRRYRRRFSKT